MALGDILRKLRNDFGGQAEPGDPDADSPDTVFAASANPRTYASPEEEEAAQADRARRLQDAAEALNADLEKKKQEDRDGGPAKTTAGIGADERPTFDMGGWSKFKDSWRLGIHEHGDYLKFKPDQRKLQEQIRAVILREVFEKGNTTLYFYRKGQIDFGISAQADTILNKMMAQGVIPRDWGIQVSMQRMAEPEPWLGWYGKMRREARNERYDTRNKKIAQRDYGYAEGSFDRLIGRGKGEREIVKRFGREALPPRPEKPESARQNAAAAPEAGEAPAVPETPDASAATPVADAAAPDDTLAVNTGAPPKGPQPGVSL